MHACGLTGTCACRVGTVECRSTAVNMFAIQPKLKEWPNVFYTGEAVAVDPTAKQITCKDALGGEYTVPYDVLAVATGSQAGPFSACSTSPEEHMQSKVLAVEQP